MQNFKAAAITITHDNVMIQQSGFVMNDDYILTIAGTQLSYLLTDVVGKTNNYAIIVHLQNEGNIKTVPGFVTYFWPLNKEIEYIKSFDIKTCISFLIIGLDFSKESEIVDFNLYSNCLKLYKGQEIMTVSTPFGDPFFFNGFTNGVISNIADEDFFLTDCRLASSGCEGGPVYL